MATKKVVAPKGSASKGKQPGVPVQRHIKGGAVDDLDGFDEDGGGVITQVAIPQSTRKVAPPVPVVDEHLEDDLDDGTDTDSVTEYEEPGDNTPKSEVPDGSINSMPRPQTAPLPTRRVIDQAELRKQLGTAGKNPSAPVRSSSPFGKGSVLNGNKYADVDPKFAEIIFTRVKNVLTNNGAMNVRNHTKRDVRNAFIQAMGEPFGNKEYFDDIVAHFCSVYHILRD